MTTLHALLGLSGRVQDIDTLCINRESLTTMSWFSHIDKPELPAKNGNAVRLWPPACCCYVQYHQSYQTLLYYVVLHYSRESQQDRTLLPSGFSSVSYSSIISDWNIPYFDRHKIATAPMSLQVMSSRINDRGRTWSMEAQSHGRR